MLAFAAVGNGDTHPTSNPAPNEEPSYSGAMTVSGLLAGFSFTAVIGLFAIRRDAAAFEVALFAFLLATFFFIISTIGAWATVEWISEKRDSKYHGTYFYKGTMAGFVLGLLSFVIGMAGTAFLHSTAAGIAAVVAGLATVAFFILAGVES